LLDVSGESLLGRQLRQLAAAGITEVVVNVARFGERIRGTVGDGRRYGVHVEYSDEGPEPLETAGGIVQALPRLGEDAFVVANADVLTDFDFEELALDGAEGQIVLVPNPAHHARGDFALGVDGFVGSQGERLTYAGIALLHPRLFAGLPPGRRPLKPILDAAIARGTLRGLRHDGLWIDVGTPERLAEAREVTAARRALDGRD
jgi:MurNAc alpha-1-phosphate uridylyltransferase